MGVKGLWKLLEPAVEKQSLDSVALWHTFTADGNIKGLILGIDASIWINSIVQAHSGKREITKAKGAKVMTVLHRLARLASKPISVIVVFDGPACPVEKRGRRVMPSEHWIVQPIKDFVQAYGYAVHMAPGEAEAELAAMNKAGVIDVVLTDDSDALVFGARAVMRNPVVKADKGDVYMCEATNIASQDHVALTTGGLVLIALLSGGDYGPGLAKCGARTARGLARYGLGEALIEACELVSAARDAAVAAWREDVRSVLRNDPRKLFKQRQPTLAASIPDTFPDVAIVRLYTHPTISTNGWNLPLSFDVHPLAVDATELARLCREHFGWGNDNDYTVLIKKMDKFVWPAVALRAVIRGSYAAPPADTRVVCKGQAAVSYAVALKLTPNDRKKDLRKVTLQTNALALPAVHAVATAARAARGNEGAPNESFIIAVLKAVPPNAAITVPLPGMLVRALNRPLPAAAAAAPLVPALPQPVLDDEDQDVDNAEDIGGDAVSNDEDSFDDDVGGGGNADDHGDGVDSDFETSFSESSGSIEPFFPLAGSSRLAAHGAVSLAAAATAPPSAPGPSSGSSVHGNAGQGLDIIDLTESPIIVPAGGEGVIDLTGNDLVDLTGDDLDDLDSE
ncbi:Flap endonuclease GEN 1-like protein [Phanerochaete sordida]|uniref:Flap endonuclease GEN 1-like protein n=1 Tax=Phanerochaete sordida TaxID=48140 RepID=A0A9P3G7C9_9APHY|nr:Flap endonuclease GEN 1-like protein [Phanerochaete sordida]